VSIIWISTIIIILAGISGCTTTNVDWEEARNINTLKSYQVFLQKHPNSEYSEQAQSRLETLIYENAKESGTITGYASYLVKCPRCSNAGTARKKIKELRCQDTGLTRVFPSWLKKGKSTDPERSASWYLADSYIGIEPSDIGRGYKATGDDPDYPLEFEWSAGCLIYYGGRGVIVGPDGKGVLLGYDCK
jgi:hypothetical protein